MLRLLALLFPCVLSIFGLAPPAPLPYHGHRRLVHMAIAEGARLGGRLVLSSLVPLEFTGVTLGAAT